MPHHVQHPLPFYVPIVPDSNKSDSVVSSDESTESSDSTVRTNSLQRGILHIGVNQNVRYKNLEGIETVPNNYYLGYEL